MRPCTCDRLPPAGAPYSTAYCRHCWLFHNVDAFNKRWGGPGLAGMPPAPEPPPVAEGPTWFKKLVTFGKAAVRHVWHGLPETPTEEQERRIALCLACEHLKPANGECAKCGCKVAVKSTWALEKCPIGRW